MGKKIRFLQAGTTIQVGQFTKLQELPYTTFLTQLLYEDLDRHWDVYKKAKKKPA